jgi:UDP-N-acetylmuramoyl-tripeptide--D-alanyl-D-alanine ligase
MDVLMLPEIAAMAGAKLLGKDTGVFISRFNKDTRTIKPGDIYIGLRGEKFDGNKFAAEAFERGAAVALLDSPEIAEKLSSTHPVLLAEDSLGALTRLAAAWRSRLKVQVLGITGSSGKTSTKEFAAAVLGAKYRVVKTQGNLNNHIGVPLSILSAQSQDEAAVWEVGMNHPGEIAPLAALIQPACAIITNIGTAHIEYMKTRDAIALEKGALAEAVPCTGAVILPAQDDKSESIAMRCRAKVVRVGMTQGDLLASDLQSTPEGMHFTVHRGAQNFPASIAVHGTHMVQNALLALAAGVEMGVPLEKGIKGLAKARLVGGRLEQKTIAGVTYLDDSYNANPESMEAALNTLRQFPGVGRRIAVLGKMGELGEHAAEGYRRTGVAAAHLADILLTVGLDSAAMSSAARDAGLGRIHEVEDTAAAARILSQLARPGDLVLVKGSRSARMETIFEHLQN